MYMLTGLPLDDFASLYFQDLRVFERFHSAVLLQLCYYGYYQDLEEGITCEKLF